MKMLFYLVYLFRFKNYENVIINRNIFRFKNYEFVLVNVISINYYWDCYFKIRNKIGYIIIIWFIYRFIIWIKLEIFKLNILD